MKRRTIATLPKDPKGRLIDCVPMDLLHMRIRIGEKLTKETIAKSAEYTGDKFATGFQNLVRLENMSFFHLQQNIYQYKQNFKGGAALDVIRIDGKIIIILHKFAS